LSQALLNSQTAQTTRLIATQPKRRALGWVAGGLLVLLALGAAGWIYRSRIFPVRPQSDPQATNVAPAAVPVPAAAPPSAAAKSDSDSSGEAVEIAFWNSVAGSSDSRLYQEYLSRYPGGKFASLAKIKLDEVAKKANGHPSPTTAAPAAPTPPPTAVAAAPSAPTKTTDRPAPENKAETPAPAVGKENAAPTAEAQAAYEKGSHLLHGEHYADSVPYFDEAIHASPNYLEAYLARAGARRGLGQDALSVDDCNKVIQINPSEAKGYNCRGHVSLFFKRYDEAVRDLNEAIRLNQKFGFAYAARGDAYSGLQQYEKALKDYNEAIRYRPKDGEFFEKRAAAFTNLKQYNKALQDYTEAIALMPTRQKPYAGRATVEELLGDSAAATADRRHMREGRKK
jgi:tetratricopeptide (TPR) repeat protein